MGDLSARWTRDLTRGWLGVGFVVLLLGSEGALTLPDEDASSSSVARFYADHGTVIVVLQVVGFVACVLLAAFALRHRPVDGRVAAAGVVLAVLALAPGIITIVTALVADVTSPARAGRFNRLEPRGDDLLFVGIVLFAVAVAACRAVSPVWLRVLAGLVAFASVVRLGLEIAGQPRGAFESVAPLGFVVLVAATAGIAFTGYPRRSSLR
jgi:hypothetical protein